MYQKMNLLAFASLLMLLTTNHAAADDPLAAIQSIASKDLLAVGYLDIDTVNLEDCLNWAIEQEIVDAENAEAMNPVTAMGQGLLQQMTKSGTEHVIALIHQEDLSFQEPPLLLFSISKDADAEKTLKSLRRILGLIQIPNFELEVWNEAILGGTADQIARAKSNTVVDRPNLTAAWNKFGGHDAGVMIFGSADTRRVAKEMFPQLEAPFENITGKMIVENLTSGGITIQLPTEIDAKIVIQTTDEKSAETIQAAAAEMKKQLLAKESAFSEMVPPLAVAAMGFVDPVVQSNDVVIDLQPLLTDKIKLIELLEPLVASSRQTQRQNDVRQILLAVLNYESARKRFPAYANFDADGKPLLSWRVHVLPFINQMELYRQFKLDEAWNSPHNIKLVELMPRAYADPSRDMKALNKLGKTRYAVPFTEGTVFFGNEGAQFKDIKDGSSNTIGVVCVAPEAAVVWTQPVDWDVDMANPKTGLFSESNPEPIIGRCDGSTQTLDTDISDEKLRALLTKDGGEVIQ